MKTLEELFNEINHSEELQNEWEEVNDKDKLTDFLKKHDCGASLEEFAAYLRQQSEGEIPDGEAQAASGGIIDMERDRWQMARDFERFRALGFL